MKQQTSVSDTIYKDVIVIGNGPSGISLSMMLSGHLPYLISKDHPDEMLSARLRHTTDRSLAEQPLDLLAEGLEGRSTNPVSLLLDALEHPYADLGIEMASLVEWRYHSDREIDHVVFGKGPPGGSWHTMDPNVLTLSLGSWMALPGYSYSTTESTDSQRRASAGSVARYYENYVKRMGLSKYFQNGVNVLSVERIQNSVDENELNRKCSILAEEEPPIRKCLGAVEEQQRKPGEVSDSRCSGNQRKCPLASEHPRRPDESRCSETQRKCSIVNALNYLRSRTKCTAKQRCKRRRDVATNHDASPDRKVRELIDRSYCSVDQIAYDNISGGIQLSSCDCNSVCSRRPRWLVTTRDNLTGRQTTYVCSDLVLANGASDLPNRLGLPAETYEVPWVLHSLRSLEEQLDRLTGTDPDPVLVVGAGLSAADAIIATRFRSVPVLHVFRNRSVSFDKQLPENMYPEYHKVHQMMLDGGSTYPLYTALPEYTVTEINARHKSVTLASTTGETIVRTVSFVVILIGSRPNLKFLPAECSLGVDKTTPIDAKLNPIDVDRWTHAVNGVDGLYAVGPLAGDNFVRFIPGGALAVVAHLYKKKHCC